MPLPRSNANRLRIIGGSCRGRVLRFPGCAGVRPTLDRVRETLFNWLGQDLSGRSTLDPFAGSGALSLEALSRGARLAVAVDRQAPLVEALRANAVTLGLDRLEAHRADGYAFVARESRSFDVVFLDPPFADDRWPQLLASAAARLAPSGAMYAEAGRRLEPPTELDCARSDRAGQVYYHLFVRR